MNRSERRESAKAFNNFLRQEAKRVVTQATSKKWTPWEECIADDMPFTRAVKNNHYVVMFMHSTPSRFGDVQRILIRDNLERPIHNWQDFQRIKDELFGKESVAIEFYPKRSELIDDANIYHLWVLPEGYDFGFKIKVT